MNHINRHGRLGLSNQAPPTTDIGSLLRPLVRLSYKTQMNPIRSSLVAFAAGLVKIKSYSGREQQAIEFIRQEMEALNYDQIFTDAMGNLVGRVGTGKKVIMFDSHVDTVAVTNPSDWTHDPFGGIIEQGRLHGRGSVDMKSGAAASVYGAALAKQLSLLDGKTVYVSCTVMEEDCDGENLKHLFKESGICPHYMVICEPSDNKIATGHKGKAQVVIKTHGVSAHGSAPEKGQNAVYEMAQIIRRIEQTAGRLMDTPGPCGTLVASQISSKSESLNAVPFECEVYLDRRMVLGETENTIKKEMDAIVEGKNAAWEIGTLNRQSYTGLEVTYHPFHLPWQIDPGHPLLKACGTAFKEVFGKVPETDYWDFSTNAVTPVSMGIPCVGFGPGEYKLAHMANESCEISKITEACEFYATLIHTL